MVTMRVFYYTQAMKIFGLSIKINGDNDLFFDPKQALQFYGGLDELSDKLVEVQNGHMGPGLYALKLAYPKGDRSTLMIRLTANKSVTQEVGAEFLRSKNIPV